MIRIPHHEQAAAVTSKKKMRADLLLVERGLAESRSKAQALIMAGQVVSDDRRVDKAGQQLAPDAVLRLKSISRFVSRGGDKMVHALEVFADHGLDVQGKICVDVGASTGGFTDCLLQHGAKSVHAVDVGYGQLHQRLRTDERVDVRERTNARNLSADDFEAPIELVVVDASFIGIGKLIDAIAAMLPPGGELVALVKPQFEAGRQEVSRSKGVIRDPEVRAAAIDRARKAIENAGLSIVAGTDSPIHGPKGNLEHFFYARRASS
jgi:23S rRNA (cytidine1920-2'-O)/16S rRNA (cytidine1409-2'-O)-methyltransferase